MSQRQELDEPQPFLHLIRSAQAFPHRPALISADVEVTYAELLAQSARLAVLLRRLGVEKGDVVAVSLRNDLQLVVSQALFSLAAVGCVYPGVIDEHGPIHVDHYLTDRPEISFPLDRTILTDEAFLEAAGAIVEPLEVDAYDDFDSVCRLAFSSGTTGRPSPIPLTIRIMEGRSRLYGEQWIPMLPLMSLITLSGAIAQHVAYCNLADGDAYLSPGSPDENLALVRDNFVGTLLASPAQLADLLAAAEREGGGLEGLGAIHSAGSVLPPPLLAALRRNTDAQLLSFYGSTEVGAVMGGSFAHDGSVRFEAPYHHQELEILAEDGSLAAPDEVGRLRIRSEFAASGYLGPNPDGAAFRDGWFYPGDLAARHDDGSISLRGRDSEVLNLGGVKIDPAAIDHVLQELPGIVDAAVFIIRASNGADRPVAAIAGPGAPDVDLLATAFSAAAQGLVLEAVFVVDAIPRSPMGKVRRGELAERYQRSEES